MTFSSSVGLILSGAFVNQELVAEFGLLPPSFLPLGVGRLYDVQIDTLRRNLSDDLPLYMTLPESFKVPDYDLHRLREKNISILFVPDNMQLGEAIIYAINVTNSYNSNIKILHGDTVIGKFSSRSDVVAAHAEDDDYSWAGIIYENDKILSFETIEATNEKNLRQHVACGYFAFSSGADLVRSISQARGNFISGLNLYIKHRPLFLEKVVDWYDFGHIQTYFQSRRIVSTARAFNSLQITHTVVRKFSSDSFKMKAESEWFKNVPPSIQPYTARFLESGEKNNLAFYVTEYQYAPNLSELFVFSSIGKATWKKILLSSVEFLELCGQTKSPFLQKTYTSQLAGVKILERLERFARETNFDISRELYFNEKKLPSLEKISRDISGLIKTSQSNHATLMHGDFCFSNILYNSRNNRISVIDPRGYVFDNKPEIWGDFRYDIAKYSHSIYGLYDFILAGRYSLDQESPYHFNFLLNVSPQIEWLQNTFLEMKISGVSVSSLEIRAMTISLFLSMLPLHADRPDRQKAFIANALRLYVSL